MTTNTSDENMGVSRPAIEDLTVISGIGKARQEWLRKTFHVRTLLDLAKLSADDIEAKLKRYFLMQNTISKRNENAKLIDLRFEDQIVLRSGI